MTDTEAPLGWYGESSTVDLFRRHHIAYIFQSLFSLQVQCTDFDCFVSLLNWKGCVLEYHELLQDCYWVIEQVRNVKCPDRASYGNPLHCIRELWNVTCNTGLREDKLLTTFQVLQWLKVTYASLLPYSVTTSRDGSNAEEIQFLDTFVGRPAGKKMLALVDRDEWHLSNPRMFLWDACLHGISRKAIVYKQVMQQDRPDIDIPVKILYDVMSFDHNIFPESFREQLGKLDSRECCLESKVQRDVAIFHETFELGMEDINVMYTLHAYLREKRCRFEKQASFICTLAFLWHYIPLSFWSRVERFLVHVSTLKEMLQLVRGFLKGRTLWRARRNIKDT